MAILNAVIDWSLRSLFDRTINRACPVARSSKVRVELPDGSSPYAITPEPGVVEEGVATYIIDASECYFTSAQKRCSQNTLTEEEALDVALSWPLEPTFEYRA